MTIKLIDFGARDRGQAPNRAHDNDAGADVYSPSSYEIYPGEIKKIGLGFGLELPDGLAGFIFPRSGLSSQGIVCELPPIDSGYRGEVHAIVSNVGRDVFEIEAGDRIGQLVIIPALTPAFAFEKTGNARGTGAFGSTGA